jgi:hypothetical protein
VGILEVNNHVSHDVDNEDGRKEGQGDIR